MEKIAIVTGGTGFIGSNVVRELVKFNWVVHLIIRPGSSLSLIDVLLEDVKIHIHDGTMESMHSIIESSSPTVVFHLASLVIADHKPEDISPLIKSNLEFSTQLIEAMANNDCNYLINTGTYWQHYENSEYSPVCLYAAMKQAFEDIVTFYTEARNLQVITLKLFDTYGQDDPRPKLFKLLMEAQRTNRTLNMSPGDQFINLVHIDDVVNAYVLSSQRLLSCNVSGHEKYAVSSSDPLMLSSIVEQLERVLGSKLPIKWGGVAYREREVMSPWKDGDWLPGWKPETPLEQGLKTLINEFN